MKFDRKTIFYNLKGLDELMEFMNNSITYGWLDIDGKKHIDTLKDIKEIYRINSLEDMFESGLGTCIEQAKMIREYFESKGIPSHVYCSKTKTFNGEHIRLHCFVIAELEDGYVYFEHSNPDLRGIHYYENFEDAYEYATINLAYSTVRKVTELDDIPEGLSFYEFIDYVNSKEEVKRR